MNPEKSPAKINKKRWTTYAAAGMVATVAGAQTAEADITHVVLGTGNGGDLTYNLGNLNFALNSTASINFVHGQVGSGTAGFALARITNSAVSLYAGSMAGFTAGGFGYASNFQTSLGGANGDLINGMTNFAPGNRTMAFGPGYGNDQFLNTGGFIAFSFAGGTQFGWARVSSVLGAPQNTYVVEEYAFTTAGENIEVGQIDAIPEPTSLGLLALGAIGVVSSRRRRKQQEA